MGSTLVGDPRDLALGFGAGVASLLIGLGLTTVAAFDRATLLDDTALAGVLLAATVAFTVAGLYEITARRETELGVADLTIGAAIGLALLAPYGNRSRAFVGLGALALLLAGVYHGARAVQLLPGTDDAAAEVEREGAT